MKKIIPDLLNYLPALSLITIIIYLYFSNKIPKDKVNNYLFVGLVATVVSYIVQFYVTKYLIVDYSSSEASSVITK